MIPIELQQLQDIVEKQDWFKLSDGQFIFYANSSTNIQLTYTSHTISIFVTRDCRGFFKISFGSHKYGRKHSRRPKTVDAACEAIRGMYSESIERVDEQIIQQQEEETRIQRLKDHQKEVVKSFGIPIESHSFDVYTFRASKNYKLTFDEIQPSDEHGFGISEIDGLFSKDQIQKLAAFLIECPQIAADRLINGK